MAASRTTLDLLTAALQTIGAYGASEALSGEDAQLALDTLQDMLAEWSDGGLMVPCTATDILPMVVGQEDYTIGESGSPSLNTVRPERVIGAFVRDSGNYDYRVEIIGEAQYRALITKTETSGRPDRMWVEYSAPNAAVHVYPSPDSTDPIYIESIKTFSEPTAYTENLVTTTYIPRNFFTALKWNLALELCTPFLREPTPLIVKRAAETKGMVKKLNMARTVVPVAIDPLYRGNRGNILEGW